MVRIKELRISRGKTVNLGNYESGRIDVEAAINLTESDDVELEYQRLSNYVKDRLHEEEQDLRQEAD